MTEVTEKIEKGLGNTNKPLLYITGGFIALFCLIALINLDALSAMVDWGFNFAANRHRASERDRINFGTFNKQLSN